MGSKGGGSGGGSTSQGFSAGTSTYSPDPEAKSWFQTSMDMALNAAQKPYTPYQGQMTAGFNPDQMSAFQEVRNLQGMAQPYYNSGLGALSQAMNYSDPRNFNQNTLNQYYSPYQKNVIDATMANLAQQQAMAEQRSDQDAMLRGAWGGSSGAAMGRAEVARQSALANAQTLSGLQNQGYQQAVGQYNQQQGQAIQTAQQAAYGLGQLGTQAQNAALTKWFKKWPILFKK